MSKKKQELEGGECSLGKRRGPKIPGKDSGQLSFDNAHQTDDNSKHIGFEIEESEIINQNVLTSKDQEMLEVNSTADERQMDAIEMETSLQPKIAKVKERCELLKKFVDQSTHVLDDNTQKSTPSFQELLTLLQTYHYGLAKLLKECCYFSLKSANYEKAIVYAKQLANLAGVLHDKNLEEEAKSILWEECTETKDKPIASFLQKHKNAQTESEAFLEMVKSGSQHRRNEYDTLNTLYNIHMELFNMQVALDINVECLKISSELADDKMTIETTSRKALIYQLLSKYERAYNIFRKILTLKIDDVKQECKSLANFSVVAQLLKKGEESLQYAIKSLKVAEGIGNKSWIACCHGNIGLAKECMGDFAGAIEPYQKCLESGLEVSDYRVINNGYCNLGRAYEGLGEKEKAKEYYKKAVDTPQPPQAHWADTEDFRFSGDYQLARLAAHDQNWSKSKYYMRQVIERCELLRKSVQDSTLKITFNDTQRKPYQYMQHALLEEGATKEALLVAENGRARDFSDKVAASDKGNKSGCLDTPKALLDFVKSQNVAVLFLSSLEVVEKICGWFISPDGNIEQFSTPQFQWKDVLTKLCVTMNDLQGRHKIEFRGIEDQEDADEDAAIEHALEMIRKAKDESGEIYVTREMSYFQPACQPQTCPTTCQSPTRKEAGACSVNKTKSEEEELDVAEDTSNFQPACQLQTCPTTSRSPTEKGESFSDDSHTIESLSTIIDELSELVVQPIQLHLEKMIVEKPAEKPQLLIIPQGMTFNIPYAALHMNGIPLCSYVTPIEAFSFHSFSHAIKQQEKCKEKDILHNSLIVGNPTNDLPFAEKEARQIAEILRVSPLIGCEATHKKVLSLLPDQRIIHFACHGQYNGSCLQLASEDKTGTSESESYLTIRDIEGMTIRADMVVLSACHTARGEINNEGVLGMARAFLMAGAKSVVTALWAIPDDATEKLMEQFYLNLKHGQPVADALCKAMCEIKETEAFRDVVHWGAFKVFGANQKVF